MRNLLKNFIGIFAICFSIAVSNNIYALDVVFSEDRPDLRTLDPRITQSRHEEMIIVQMFDQLISADSNGNQYPGLAKSWDVSSNGLEYTFKACRNKHEGVMNNSKSMIRCEKLNKWYGGVHALKDVSVDIKKGESVGLVGDNGAGKSTFIKILSGVHKQDKGEVYFDGRLADIKNAKDSMKLGIETIFQDSALAPTLSIARNLFVGREPLTFKLGSYIPFLS